MKIKNVIYLALVTLIGSCGKSEMQLSKSDVSILTEMENHSPIYLDIKEEKLQVNTNNKIGSTNWIFHVNKSVNLVDAITEVKTIVDKKYAEKMHADSLGVYFSYSDTLQNKLNFLPFKGISFKNTIKDTKDVRPNLIAFQEDKSFYFKNKLYDFKDINNVVKSASNEVVTLTFHPNSSFETYIQIKTKLFSFKNLNTAEYFY